MSLILSRPAAKALAAMPKTDRERMLKSLNEVSLHGLPHSKVTQLVNRGETFRLRQGDWRAVFVIEEGKVTVIRVGHRREVYD